MFPRRWFCAALAVAGLFCSLGCQMVSKTKLTACEAQSRANAEHVKALLAENENLKSHSRSLGNKLIQAEDELAVIDEKAGLDRQRLSNYQREREKMHQQLAGSMRGKGLPPGVGDRLADLSRRHPGLQFDPQSGASKFDNDVLFDSGEARLRPDALGMLDEFATLLKEPQARELRVMVVGHADDRQIVKSATRERYPDNWHLSSARALAVAEYLQQAGVREEQLGIASLGRHQPISPNDTADDRQRNRRVEIFVMGPDTPIVGWTETATGLY